MTAREHVARTRKKPCIECGWGPIRWASYGAPAVYCNEAHHVDSPRTDWAVIPLCPTCHQPTGSGHARGLGRRELGYLKAYLRSLPADYAEEVRAGIRAAWEKRLGMRSGQRYRECLE